MRRVDFRKRIDAELTRMGYRKGSWIWQANPARLTICIDGTFKDIPIKANMKKELLAYQLGRLQGWADLLGYEAPPAAEAPAKRTRTRQIDLEDAIEAAGARA